MKRTFSLLLCLMLVLSLATPVFAASNHNHTITIANDNVTHPDYVYKAYQVFSGVLDETGTLSNIEWGSGVNSAALLAELKKNEAYKDCNDAEDVATVLAKNPEHDNAVAVAFADLLAYYTVAEDDVDIETNRTYPYLNAANAKSSTFNSETKKYKIEVTGDGYYLVLNTTIPVDDNGNITENTTYSRHILQVVRDVDVSHKGTFPESGKVINENDVRKSVNEASIGDVIAFDIWGTLPSNLAFYDTYFYRFNDTMSKGLTYNNDAEVTIRNAGADPIDVTDYFWIHASDYDPVNGTQITIAIQDLLALRNLKVGADGHFDDKGTPIKIDAHTQVVVKYTATLNKNAVIGVAGNPNVLDLDFSNNPNVDGDPSTTPPTRDPEKPEPEHSIGETPDHQTITYTTELKITKVNGKNEILSGAEFTLTGNGVNVVLISGDYFRVATDEDTEPAGGWWYLLTDGTYTQTRPTDDDPATEDVDESNKEVYDEKLVHYVREDFAVVDSQGNTVTNVKAFVDETTGVVTFSGLGVGTYTLTETVTPKGFNTCDPIEFEILFSEESKTFSVSNNTINLDSVHGVFSTTVVNEAGSKLPSTGGMGTTLFYVFGSIMFIGAAVLLITKKRMDA